MSNPDKIGAKFKYQIKAKSRKIYKNYWYRSKVLACKIFSDHSGSKEVIAVFERPARHRYRSGEAGGRYLKKIPPGFAVAKYVGFTP